MKYRRLAAAASVAVLLSLNTVGNALADPAEPEVPDLDSTTCLAAAATADGDVPPSAWHLDRLDMQAVWDLATGNKIKVAVIDTGVAATGTPFFAGNRIKTLDLLDGMSEDDRKARGIDCAHGTAVASLIAAARPDGKDVDVRTDFAGIAPDATIISYRVLGVSQRQEGREIDPLGPTIAAVRDATKRGVHIINLSQSVNGSDSLLADYRNAVADALQAGIVVVAAAGNAGPDVTVPSYPGYFDGVISVGSSSRTDAASVTSLANTDAILGAPGEDLMALGPSKSRENAIYTNQAYANGIDGTSFAAPIVSGVVALMLEANPKMTPNEVMTRLVETADPPPAAVPDSRIGYGIVNPMRALTGVARPQEGNPEADTEVPVDYQLTAEEPDMVPAMIAVSVGAGAVVLAAVGLVLAISLPAATRRNRS